MGLFKSGKESGGDDIKPNPDPTVYTNDAIERAAASQRDYINGKIESLNERLKGMDRATALVEITTNQVPELIKTDVGHLHEIVGIEITAIKDALAAAEVLRVEQKNDATTGLAAALSAQKELAAAENTSNKLAISKSEQATSETIKTNQDANNERFAQVIKSMDEAKLAISRLETSKQAVTADRTESRAQGNYTMAIVSSIIGVTLFVTGIIGTYVIAQDKPTTPAVVTVETPAK